MKRYLVAVLMCVFLLNISVSHADISRVKSWASGEVLTAPTLNAEFDNIVDYLNAGLFYYYALSEYDDIAASATALNALNAECVLVLDSSQSMDESVSFDAEVTIIPTPGNVVTLGGYNLTVNSQPEAGPFRWINQNSTGRFKMGVVGTTRASWFYSGTGDVGPALSSAAQAFSSLYAGEVLVDISGTATTVIDWTCLHGIQFQGFAGDAPQGGASIVGSHAGIVFDCAGAASCTYRDFVFGGDSTTTPTVGFFFSRTSTPASNGDQIKLFNIRTDAGVTDTSFSVAPIYSYGSEIFAAYSCAFRNREAGGKNMVFTANNINSITSANVTVETGSQSNTVINLYDMSLYCYGGGNSDNLYLEGASDFKLYGGFFYNTTGSADGRAYIYMDTTNEPSQHVSIDGVRCETGANRASYGVYAGDTAANLYSLKLSNSRFNCETATIKFHDNVTPYFLTVDNSVYENNSGVADINGKDFQYPVIDYYGTFTASGTVTRGNVRSTALSITTESEGVTLNRASGLMTSAYGFVRNRGTVAAIDFAVGDLTTDATWNALDLSGIIPTTAKFVLLSVHVSDDVAGEVLIFRPTAGDPNENRSTIATQVANIANYADMWVPVGASRAVYYYATNVVWTTINITVKGWSF